MGKKSNSKKKNKNIAQLQTKKETRKETPKIKEHTKRRVDKRTIFGGVLVLIMLSLLVTVGYLLFNKAFKPQPVAKILSERNVIALLEINSNFDHNQVIKAMDLLKNHPEYSKENLLKFVEDRFNVNYEKDMEPWLGREIGVAFLATNKENGGMNKIYFAEIGNPENARNYFEKGDKLNYEGYQVYKLKNPAYTVFIGDYVFISDDEKTIYELLDSQKNGDKKLYSADKYRRIDNNLPINKVAFFYLDFEKINNGFIKNFPILNKNGLSIESFSQFFKIFRAEGFAIVALDDNFVIQSFLSLDPENLEDSEYIAIREKYYAKLTDYIATDTLALYGGVNLEYQLKRMVEVLSGGNEDAITFINALIQNYAQKYFGADINFGQDILPLLEKEFAVAVEQIDGKNIYKVLIELENPDSDKVMLKNIAEKFAKNGGIFEPKIVEHKLADGTISKEIVAVPETIEKVDSVYRDIPVYGLKIGQREWGIYYAVINDVAVMATHIDGVKNSIDIFEGDKDSLKSTAIFGHQIAPILKNSDEITYFNFKKLFPLLMNENSINKYLKPIESFTSGKSYFNDGIVTINYLHID